MANLIYSIKIHDLNSSGLHVLDVKIGKTTNIERTLTQYRRSGRGIEVLDLWEPNKQLTLSQCETGAHRLAKRYAYSKESEKFIFLQDGYNNFSDNISLLLKKTSNEKSKQKTRGKYSETSLLEGSNEIVNLIYKEIKNRMINFDDQLIFNPQRCYISIKKRKNFAYIEIRITKIRIVVLLPLKIGRNMIKKHNITELSQGVKDYYGSECFAVSIDDQKNLDEVIELLKKAHKFNEK